MDISNKILAAFLLAAIVVSLAGTIISVNKIGDLSTTGFATADGTASLEILEVLDITTEDSSSIGFGNCEIDSGADLVLDSTEDNAGVHGACDEYSSEVIAIRNAGNQRAAVTVQASDVGEAHNGTFLTSESGISYLAYKVNNAGVGSGNDGGCEGNLVEEYTNFTEADQGLNLCDNLHYVQDSNSVTMDVQTILPSDVDTGEYTVTFTYTAEVYTS